MIIFMIRVDTYVDYQEEVLIAQIPLVDANTCGEYHSANCDHGKEGQLHGVSTTNRIRYVAYKRACNKVYSKVSIHSKK
jgi:hypothetical protein